MQRAAASQTKTPHSSRATSHQSSAASTPPKPTPTPSSTLPKPSVTSDPDAETPWEFSYVPSRSMQPRNSAPKIQIISGCSIDELESEDDAEVKGAADGDDDEDLDDGRMVFGTFRAEEAKARAAAAKLKSGYKSSSSDDDSSSDSNDDGSSDDSDEDSKARRKKMKKEKKREKQEKAVLQKLQKRGLERGGLSGAGTGAKMGAGKFTGACYNCGEEGHMGKDCTRGKKRRKVEIIR
ncbi:hypothetical protein EX30DRAFT_338291 [Ascodesmis nigricans]|uniref:CCHC-type domain-containing protein n=1 Tax=Ascodesmis nigricans TaxID=341454 RepID=A0A4S2N3C4_9PEZI|nr:hypothetical protein EX30DRAFT_338291 [Ascodesmis nigricans]